MTESHENLVQQAYIASACTADWNAMEGDDRVRMCSQCNLNVYNVANMTSSEANALLSQSEGRVCMRLFRRHDGTIVTDDCPFGLRKYRDGLKAAVVFLLVTLGFGGLIAGARAQGFTQGEVAICAREQPQTNFTWLNWGFALSSLGWVGILVARKRASLWMIGGGLAVLGIVFGIVYGVLNAHLFGA